LLILTEVSGASCKYPAKTNLRAHSRHQSGAKNSLVFAKPSEFCLQQTLHFREKPKICPLSGGKVSGIIF
jgi:hypothetical protein